MKAVFLDQATFIESVSIDAIAQQVDSFEVFPLTTTDEIIPRCLDADIVITNKVVLSQELIKQLPQLKLICVAATGTNNIDIAAAEAQQIKVMNVAGYSTASVSQYVFAQLLEFYSQTSKNNDKVAHGDWPKSATFCIHSERFDELSGKKLGIVGYGDIGKKIANIAEAFDMQVLLAERPQASVIRTGRISFDEMLKQADIVSLHCPHTPDTENLFNYAAFAKMKSTALLINTARGAVIDNTALRAALDNKIIAGAILDVLEQEPPPADHILLKDQPENLKITAHIAWASAQAQQRLLNLIANNIEQFSQRH
ncbi:MAG: D-2-hydroxyacid dehydrogenase [Thalassotalea sp.]